MKTIALFGGSFDPPHIAHEAVVREALKINDVDKVVIMPTFLNPFKTKFYASAQQRIQWLKKIFKTQKNVEISSFEVDLNRTVPTIESVKYLLKRYKKIYLIIGADNLETLSLWQSYEELKTLVTFVVASRNKINIPKGFVTLNVDVDISSTTLRTAIDKEKLSPLCAQEIEKFYKEKNEQ